MLLIEERKAADRESLGQIHMLEDGMFEGRIYRTEPFADPDGQQSGRQASGAAVPNYEVCALTETLPRAQTILYGELGQTCSD
jgi:hypothetical protein